MEKTKKNRRGGRREGAGRPRGTSKMYTFRADKEVAEYIDSQANKTEFIRTCIANSMQNDDGMDRQIGTPIPAARVKPMHMPFFDVRIVAGFPIPLNDDEQAQDIELLRMLCPHPDSSYLIRVQGNSMIHAGVNDGDILIVDKSCRQPSEKDIAVCELNGEYTVKRVMEKDGRHWLVPANPDYPEIEIKEGDMFSVWGVVTYIIHKPQY